MGKTVIIHKFPNGTTLSDIKGIKVPLNENTKSAYKMINEKNSVKKANWNINTIYSSFYEPWQFNMKVTNCPKWHLN